MNMRSGLTSLLLAMFLNASYAGEEFTGVHNLEWLAFLFISISGLQSPDNCYLMLNDYDDLTFLLKNTQSGCRLIMANNTLTLQISGLVDLSPYQIVPFENNTPPELTLLVPSYLQRIVFITSAQQSDIKVRIDLEQSNISGEVFAYKDKQRQILLAGPYSGIDQELLNINPMAGGMGDDDPWHNRFWHNRFWHWLKRSLNNKFRPSHISGDYIDELQWEMVEDELFSDDLRCQSPLSMTSEKTLLWDLGSTTPPPGYYEQIRIQKVRWSKERARWQRQQSRRQYRAALSRAELLQGSISPALSVCTIISPLTFVPQIPSDSDYSSSFDSESVSQASEPDSVNEDTAEYSVVDSSSDITIHTEPVFPPPTISHPTPQIMTDDYISHETMLTGNIPITTDSSNLQATGTAEHTLINVSGNFAPAANPSFGSASEQSLTDEGYVSDPNAGTSGLISNSESTGEFELDTMSLISDIDFDDLPSLPDDDFFPQFPSVTSIDAAAMSGYLPDTTPGTTP